MSNAIGTSRPSALVLRLNPDLSPTFASPNEPGPAAHAVMPCSWVLAGGLRAFRDDTAYAGRSTAALKIFLTLALEIPTGSRLRHERGSVLLAYEEISALTGLSHQLVAAGKKVLTDQGLISTRPEGQGRRLRYFLNGYDEAPGRRQLPYRLIPAALDEPAIADLRCFSTRQVSDLHTLKVFLCLCALSRPGEDRALFNLDRLSGLTNIPAQKGERALENLVAHGLVVLRTSPGDASNEAWNAKIVGLCRGRTVG